jgi:outer membrane protein assembly factor BamB
VATTAAANYTTSIFSISANRVTNGILWGVETQVGRHAVDAFNATNMKLLYSSTQNPRRPPIDPTGHFDVPTIANGKVYVGTSDNLVALGLLPKNTISGGNDQTGTAPAQPLQVTA